MHQLPQLNFGFVRREGGKRRDAEEKEEKRRERQSERSMKTFWSALESFIQNYSCPE